MSGHPQVDADRAPTDVEPAKSDAAEDTIDLNDAESAAPRPEEAVNDRARARQLFVHTPLPTTCEYQE